MNAELRTKQNVILEFIAQRGGSVDCLTVHRELDLGPGTLDSAEDLGLVSTKRVYNGADADAEMTYNYELTHRGKKRLARIQRAQGATP